MVDSSNNFDYVLIRESTLDVKCLSKVTRRIIKRTAKALHQKIFIGLDVSRSKHIN